MRAAASTQGNSNGSSQPTNDGAHHAAGTVVSESIRRQQQLTLCPNQEEGSRMIEKANTYRTQFPDPDWHQIAERAADEKDPKKLAFLIKALCDRLEELKQLRFSERK